MLTTSEILLHGYLRHALIIMSLIHLLAVLFFKLCVRCVMSTVLTCAQMLYRGVSWQKLECWDTGKIGKMAPGKFMSNATNVANFSSSSSSYQLSYGVHTWSRTRPQNVTVRFQRNTARRKRTNTLYLLQVKPYGWLVGVYRPFQHKYGYIRDEVKPCMAKVS